MSKYYTVYRCVVWSLLVLSLSPHSKTRYNKIVYFHKDYLSDYIEALAIGHKYVKAHNLDPKKHKIQIIDSESEYPAEYFHGVHKDPKWLVDLDKNV